MKNQLGSVHLSFSDLKLIKTKLVCVLSLYDQSKNVKRIYFLFIEPIYFVNKFRK
jgi:hypothetical protein